MTQATIAGAAPIMKRRRSTPAAPATSDVYTRRPGTRREMATSRAPACRSRADTLSRCFVWWNRSAAARRPCSPTRRAHPYPVSVPAKQHATASGRYSQGSRPPVPISTPAETSINSPGTGSGTPASSAKSKLHRTTRATTPCRPWMRLIDPTRGGASGPSVGARHPARLR